MGKLNKESSVALYQQLIDEIKNQITSGKLAVGDRLMTEFELSQEYNVSRTKGNRSSGRREYSNKKTRNRNICSRKKTDKKFGDFYGIYQQLYSRG